MSNEAYISYHNQENCHICRKKLEELYVKDKIFGRVRDYCHYTGKYRGTADSICHLQYGTLKEISVVFHNESNWHYDFIITELVKKF